MYYFHTVTELYPYTKNWLRLDQCRPDLEKNNQNKKQKKNKKKKGKVQGRLTGVFTPLKVAEWDHMLAQCPDKQYVAYLLSGIHAGRFPDQV